LQIVAKFVKVKAIAAQDKFATMAASSSADTSPPAFPPPAQARQPPVWARPFVILINVHERIDRLQDVIDAKLDYMASTTFMPDGLYEDYIAAGELCREKANRELAAYFDWRGTTPVEPTAEWFAEFGAEFNYWFYNPYRLDLRKARRDLNQWLELGGSTAAA
jgi:hypothetical protein